MTSREGSIDESNNLNFCDPPITHTGTGGGSISSFSSSSSSREAIGDNFKSKFDQEKERNRKLNEKLAGYRTIVNQFSKEHQEKQVLQQKIADLEKELAEKSHFIASQTSVTARNFQSSGVDQMQGCGEVLTELSHHPQSGLTSKQTSNNSPSFVVIQRYGQESLPGPKQNSGQHLSNTAPSHGDSTAVESQNGRVDHSTINSQIETSYNDIVQPERTDLISSEFERVSLCPAEDFTQYTKSNLQTLQRNNSCDKKSFDMSISNTEFTKISKVEASSGRLSHPNAAQDSMVEQSVSQKYSNPKGVVTITAWSGQTVKPVWQMEQEGLINRTIEAQENSQLISWGKPWTSPCDSQTGTETKTSTLGSQLPVTNDDVTVANETHEDKLLQEEVNSTLQPPQIHNISSETPTGSTIQPLAPIQKWGVGARPKDRNNLGDVQPVVSPIEPLIPQSNAEIVSNSVLLNTPSSQGETKPNVEQKTHSLKKTSDLPLVFPLTNSNKAEAEEHASSVKRNHFKADTLDQSKVTNLEQSGSPASIGDNIEQWVNISPEDLMKFPSLKSSPFLEEKLFNDRTAVTPTSKDSKPLQRVGSDPPRELICMSEKQVLATPSDDQPQLASQAQSMAAVMGHHAGISDMLYQFAKTASQMEEKLVQCQALIQRQQVQIQSQHNYEHEVVLLRKENKGLLAYINEMRAQQTQPSIVEHGWTMLEKPQKTSASANSETAKKLQALEEINVRLFQANKEWFTKWESLRLQTKDAQLELESQLKAHKGDKDRLQREVQIMEEQLREAVTARQEEKKKNLELEQEKLNMKKKQESHKSQVENLLREKRQLQTDIATMKANTVLMKKSGEDGGKSIEDLKTEIFLLKQQAKLFHDDFQREREDRSKAQGKAEKLRKEREVLKLEMVAKTKKTVAMMKTKDEDIKQKSRQLVDLQYQLDEMNQQLQRERRKNQQSQQVHRSTSAPVAPHTAPLVYPSVGASQVSLNHTVPLTSPAGPPQRQQSLSPEHLPGAWQCQACTFINFPERSICDICGWTNSPENGRISISNDTASGRGTDLESRGDVKNTTLDDVPDVVPDTDPDTEQTNVMVLQNTQT